MSQQNSGVNSFGDEGNYPEITPFSRYFYFVLTLFNLIIISLLVILSAFISWWYIFIILVPLGGFGFIIYIFLRKSWYLRWSAMGISVVGYVILFSLYNSALSSAFPFVSIGVIVFITSTILIFIKNYRDTRFPFMNR